mmetsp:Transcript_17594/g.35812  ORF Transcript_17594/g.35812 Transcript_17594/m.35812 type:complete len:382 (+) Transcript_17594:121-1266(+)
MEDHPATSLLPGDSPEQQHQQQQDALQHGQMQQQGFIGFGMDPNWGFGQVMHGQHGYHHNHSGMQPGALDGSQLIPGLAPSMDPLEALLGPFPCARVRGLPFEATLEDVLVFFQGLVVIDVVLVPHPDSGEAFVVFANPMDFQMGLQRDHQNMGRRYLEVFQGKRSDYYAAIAAQHHHWQGTEGLLNNNETIEGQAGEHGNTPSSGAEKQSDGQGATAKSGSDVVAWGNAGSSPSHSNQNQKGSAMGGSGSNTGGSYRGRGHYGGRGYRGNFRGGERSGQGGGIRDGPHTGFIRMRGLPFQATKQDILEFFKEYKPIENSILLTYRGDGRATGEGYVAFNNAADAKAAMALHRNMIGSRYIELFISNKEEHSRNVSRSNPR